MKPLFNSSFELSLRLLLTLSLYEAPLRLDQLLFADFLTTYSANFNLTATNLHGNNVFYLSELAVRRSQIQKALKELVLKGLVLPEYNKKGFSFQIPPAGKALCQNFTSTYAIAYLKNAQVVKHYSENKTELQLLRWIQSKFNERGE